MIERDRSRTVAGIRISRLPGNPVIQPHMLPGRDGENINGPSLVRTPHWLPDRLAEYYLYFAHHGGQYIRLAYADELSGPWKIHAPGTLHIRDVGACHDHIASPDVHIDSAARRIRMYFHGPVVGGQDQKSFVALSADGRKFLPLDEILGNFYLRVAPWRDGWIGVAKGGVLYLSETGLGGFQRLPQPAFDLSDDEANDAGSVRHVALRVTQDCLDIYYTRIGDAPERILRSQIDLGKDPSKWRAGEPELVLAPENPWEGADLPVFPSRPGTAKERENSLRDPAILLEGQRTFLAYSVAGESGIAIAEIIEG